MLRVLELLNVVVDVQALEVVLIELRQLLDFTEPALDVAGRPLRVLLGESARRSVKSQRSGVAGGLVECGYP